MIRVFAFLFIVISMLVLALGGLETVASRRLPVTDPLPSAAVSATWYWR